MFKNAFLSEYSFGSSDDYDNVLKANLLSNEKIVIPAATIMRTDIGRIIESNIDVLGKGAISIAHGSDINDLLGYVKKYNNHKWEKNTIDLFKEFNNNKLSSVYQVEKTILQFNKLMKQCAINKNGLFSSIFENKDFCNTILNETDFFDLTRYNNLIDLYVKNTKNKKQLKAHAMYFYNYFGSTSTGSGNTFSLENTTDFNYISKGYEHGNDAISGINILISSALEFTDGTEDFNAISSLKNDFLTKMSYKDILEIRDNWLHSKVIDRYEQVVEQCANAYLNVHNNNIDDALMHIEHAFELKHEIMSSVSTKLQWEIGVYRGISSLRFLANTPIIKDIFDAPETLTSVSEGVKEFKNAIKLMMQGTTEVATLTHNEIGLNNLIDAKTHKWKEMVLQAQVFFRAKSPVIEYLKVISEKLDNK